MSKILRKTAVPFSTSALSNQIEQFGSKNVTGSLVSSYDPAVIQGLTAWTQGWTAAQYLGQFAPYYQDRNGVDLVAIYQTEYALQMGLPEWDSATIYFANSYVTYQGQIFRSRQDNNSNVIPGNTTNAWWFLCTLSTSTSNPTRTVFTSGTGTYTPPTNCAFIFVRILGGGAGGGAYNTTPPGYVAGGAGSASVFRYGNPFSGPSYSVVVNGGNSGAGRNGTGAFPAGGTATNGDVNVSGGAGKPGIEEKTLPVGGNGGASKFSGYGVGGYQNASGSAAIANTGSGGGGAALPNVYVPTGGAGAPGGGAGGYAEKTFTNPGTLAPFSYTVGAGGIGAGGTNGMNGGNGAAGIIIIDETYF